MAGLVAGLGAERVIGIDAGAVADPCARLNELLDGMPDVRRAAGIVRSSGLPRLTVPLGHVPPGRTADGEAAG